MQDQTKPSSRQRDTDKRNLLATEARILQEDSTHVVVAVRIEKATLYRNWRLISALGERAIEGDAEGAEPNAPKVPVIVRAALVAAPTAVVAAAKLPMLHAVGAWLLSQEIRGRALGWRQTGVRRASIRAKRQERSCLRI
jgi:hypothetical protein